MNRLISVTRSVPGKILIVLSGCMLAVVFTSIAVALYIAIFRGGRQGSGGMAAFGDSILFLWILGMMAVPATAAALYFLRPCRPFWRFATVVAVVISVVAVGDVIGTLLPFRSDTSTAYGVWSMLAPVRVLLAPPLGAGLFLAAIFAPGTRYRYTLFGATAVEAVTFVLVFAIWFSGTA